MVVIGLLVHGSAVGMTEIAPRRGHANAVTVPGSDEGSLALPTARAPDLAPPSRDPQPHPAGHGRVDTLVGQIAATHRARVFAPSPPARHARSNPERVRAPSSDDPPH